MSNQGFDRQTRSGMVLGSRRYILLKGTMRGPGDSEEESFGLSEGPVIAPVSGGRCMQAESRQIFETMRGLLDAAGVPLTHQPYHGFEHAYHGTSFEGRMSCTYYDDYLMALC